MTMKWMTLVAVGATLGGCATIDTGYIDYRRAEEPDNVPGAIRGYDCERSQGNSMLQGRICDPLLQVELIRKNVSGKIGIQPDDVYSIRLDHGFMRYVSELPFRPERILDGKNPLRAQAEIVVLARAFEFGPQARADVETVTSAPAEGAAAPAAAAAGAAATPATEPVTPATVPMDDAFVDLTSDSLNAARVIYYSPDVENGQSLNFSNIPILGPIKYGGRPVGVQIIVLELDRVSPEMKGLLSSLASLGQTAGAIPTGGAANVLIGLGKSLLESNQDDLVFEYRFVLDRSDRVHAYNAAPFEEGRYVLRRLQTRRAAHVWRDLRLDHNTGQLYLNRTGVANRSEPYLEETYFTVNIINHGKGAKEAVYVNQSLSRLRSAIEASATATNGRAITELSGEIDAATMNYRGDTVTRDLVMKWEQATGGAVRLAYNSPPADEPDETCTLKPLPGAQRTMAELELAQSVGAFVRAWTDALDPETQEVIRFGDAEQLRVADALGSFFFGLDEAPERPKLDVDSFVDTAKFNTLVTATGDSSLLNLVRAYAAAMAPDTCDELIGSNLAVPAGS